MQISNIEPELDRNNDNLFSAYLYQDKPDSDWYSCTEWSAYLIEFYPNNLSDNQKLNPTHINNDDSTIIRLGLKLSSFRKYLPGVDISADSLDTIHIKLDPNKFPDIDLSNYKDKLNEWKSSIKVKSNNKSKEKVNTLFSSPATFSSIMKMILNYDTYNKSESDLRLFILNLKSRCASMI